MPTKKFLDVKLKSYHGIWYGVAQDPNHDRTLWIFKGRKYHTYKLFYKAIKAEEARLKKHYLKFPTRR